MNNLFLSKTNDFTAHCTTAFKHYKNGYYADALTNMRKAGEAFCKLIFIFKFSEKAADARIVGKNLNELIDSVARENFIPHAVLHSLRGLQLHGNAATHDGKVLDAQSHAAIRDLAVLISWLFDELLKARIPDSLKKEMEELLPAIDISRKLKQELEGLQKEKAEAEKHFEMLKVKDAEEKKKMQQLEEELHRSENRMKELEQKQGQIELLERQLTELKSQVDEVKNPLQEHQAERKPLKKNRRIGMVAVSAVAIVTISVILFRNYIPGVRQAVPESTNGQKLFSVIILPFNVLQDNPNIHLKLEGAIESRLKQRISELNVPIHISFDSAINKSSFTTQEAIAEGKKEKADIVLYGELYEPMSATAATQFNLKVAGTNDKVPYSEETGIRSFMSLTDSSANTLLGETEFIVFGSLVSDYMGREKISEALALLYKIKPVSKKQKEFYYYCLAGCHTKQNNYTAAIREAENYIALDSNNSAAYSLMGSCYYKMQKMSEAAQSYEKALKLEPNNTQILLNYAATLPVKNNQNKIRNLIAQALTYDSTLAVGWYQLGNLEYYLKNMEEATKDYEKSIHLDSTRKEAKMALARTLAWDLSRPEQAESLWLEVLKADSTDTAALFSLGNLYTSTKLSNPQKAEYYFGKAKQFMTGKHAYDLELGLGMNAMHEGNFQKAKEHLLKAYALDSSYDLISNYLAQSFYKTNEPEQYFYFMHRAYELDSLNSLNNFNMGQYYYENAPHKDIDKSMYYFQRALLTNPYDAVSLERLGSIYYNKGNFVRARELFGKLLSLSPDNAAANIYLATMLEREEKFAEAIPYFTKAISGSSSDEFAHYKIAYCMMRTDEKKYMGEAMTHALKAVELAPDDADAQKVLAQMYLFAGDFGKAREIYGKAIALNPAVANTEIEKAIEFRR